MAGKKKKYRFVVSMLVADRVGVTNNKTTAVRLIPVPGKKRGQRVDFGGLFGSGTVAGAACPDGAEEFVNRGGRIPAPLRSLTN